MEEWLFIDRYRVIRGDVHSIRSDVLIDISDPLILLYSADREREKYITLDRREQGWRNVGMEIA